MECPLCCAPGLETHALAHGRRFLRCSTCKLVSVDPSDWPDAAAELAHYQKHENDPQDVRYRRFLDRLAEPLLQRVESGAEGLDYGAGPGPTLSVMLEEAGCRMRFYDPFFHADASALGRTYDFITATEVVEHFHRPGEELRRLDGLLRPGGWLALMTEFVPERPFEQWRYARDPTHVCFYSPPTLRWIALEMTWLLEIPRINVALYRKPGGGEQVI